MTSLRRSRRRAETPDVHLQDLAGSGAVHRPAVVLDPQHEGVSGHIDGSQHIERQVETAGRPAAGTMLLDLTNPTVRAALAGTPDRPAYRVDGGRLHLLDRLVLVPDGGRHGRGYRWAEHAINPHNWFFGAHFFQDPVIQRVELLRAHGLRVPPRLARYCPDPR